MDPSELSNLAARIIPERTSEQKVKTTLEQIKEIFSVWRMSVASMELTQKDHGSYKFEVVFKLAEFLDDFVFVGRMVYYLREEPYKINFETLLANNDFTPVAVKSPNTRFLLRRHILKLNALLRYGSFSVDDIGLIKFHLLWNYENNAHLAMRTKEDIEKWMKISFATTMSTLKVNMTKLLITTEMIDPEKYNLVVQTQGSQVRQLPKFFFDDQEKLKDLLVKGVSLKAKGKPIETETAPKYPYPFYQTVSTSDFQYHGQLTVGGYAAIHIVKTKMRLQEGEKQVEKNKYFLVKVPKKPANLKQSDADYVRDIAIGKYTTEDPRITVERQVLSSPGDDKRFPHIARYYDDVNKNYERPMLYMENYMPQNLHEFNSKKDLSVGTKLSWLYQLSHVLNYLKKNKIVHVDLKSSNIVVAKNFFLKVIDFAESILKKDGFKNKKRATTVPFSSPESLEDHMDQIDYDSDVFSFAHIAYELVGGKLMVGFKRSSEHKLRQKYREKSFKLLPIMNWLNYQGPVYLMQYMYLVIMLCSLSHPASRFPQEVLATFIKEYAVLQEKLF